MAFCDNRRIAILICIIIISLLAFISIFIFNLHQNEVFQHSGDVNQADKTLKEVLDRLDARIAEGLGDYTAIITETPVNEDGTLNKQLSAVNLYAQSGQASLWCRYLVGDELLPNGRRRNAPTMSIPKNWPQPEIEDVLQQAINMLPSEYLVRDGNQVWPFAKGQKWDDLAGRIWFGREQLLVNTRGAKAKLLKDVNRPDLTGLYVEGHINKRIEQTYWIDPNRDDMPVELLSHDYSEDGKTVVVKLLTEYIDYAQLSDGRWYPAHWQMTSEVGKQARKSCREYYLNISTEIKLDEIWFTNPEGRLQSSVNK